MPDRSFPYPSLNRPPERRAVTRTPFPSHLVVVWADTKPEPLVYEMVDLSGGGTRLIADESVPVGRNGHAVHILPERTKIDRGFTVVWCLCAHNTECHFGVRFEPLGDHCGSP